MNGVQAAGAFPATTVLQITSNRPIPAPANRRADDVIVAAVTYPPRFGETRPLADLMPQVLARYGLVEGAAINETSNTVDLLA